MTESATKSRESDLPVAALFLARWSPRAFDGSPLAEQELLTLLEAARWAPSAFNTQPWRFCYALRDSPHWAEFVDVLLPFNQSWACTASALLFIASIQCQLNPETRAIEPLPSHSFDSGAAWGFLAIQAALMGLRTHAMLGFDSQSASRVLRLPADHRLEAAVAIGRVGDASHLSEKLRARERPSVRKALAEIAWSGRFPARDPAG
jgi:nitroreductase